MTSQQENNATSTHANSDPELGNTTNPSEQTKEEAIDAVETKKNGEETKSNPTKLVIGLLFLSLIVYVIIDSFTARHVGGVRYSDSVPDSWKSPHTGAGFVFASALGNLWLGVAIGSAVVWVGASAGAIGAFLVGRYLLRDSTAKLAEKYTIFQAVDSALKEQGLKISTLL